MTKEKGFTLDASWGGVYKASGLALFAGGAILVIFIPSIFIMRVSLPLSAGAVLEDPLPPVLLFCLAAFGEFLLMPGVLGLYLSLKDVQKTNMLIGTAMWLMAIPMFLVSRGQIISLAPISAGFAVTTSQTMKAAYMASAELAIEVANVYSVIALDLLQVGAVIISLVMLKSVFGKGTAYLVMIAGILTILGTFGVVLEVLTFLTMVGLILTSVWQIVVGVKLYRLGEIVPEYGKTSSVSPSSI